MCTSEFSHHFSRQDIQTEAAVLIMSPFSFVLPCISSWSIYGIGASAKGGYVSYSQSRRLSLNCRLPISDDPQPPRVVPAPTTSFILHHREQGLGLQDLKLVAARRRRSKGRSESSYGTRGQSRWIQVSNLVAGVGKPNR